MNATAEPLFQKLRDALEAAAIPYMITGSFVSAVHGVPRATHDIDVVIAPTAQKLLLGVQVYAATPEDILIAKLEWAKMGESERQIRDTAGIIEIQGAALDVPYVEKWVRELGLEQQWRLALERVG